MYNKRQQIRIKVKEDPVKREREKLLDSLRYYDGESDEYERICARLHDLDEIKKSDDIDPKIVQTSLACATNVGIAAMVIRSEQFNVLSSKALQLLFKLKPF